MLTPFLAITASLVAVVLLLAGAILFAVEASKPAPHVDSIILYIGMVIVGAGLLVVPYSAIQGVEKKDFYDTTRDTLLVFFWIITVVIGAITAAILTQGVVQLTRDRDEVAEPAPN